MNIVIVILIIMQIITFIKMFSDRKDNYNSYKNLKNALRDIQIKFNRSDRIIKILIENTDILYTDDIILNYYNGQYVGFSKTKYKPNTFIEIEGVVYVIETGDILDNIMYRYELTPLGGYLW